MDTDSMFVEPEITIKEEAPSSVCDEDSFSDTSSDSSAPPTTPQVDCAESMAHRSMREDQVGSLRDLGAILGAD